MSDDSWPILKIKPYQGIYHFDSTHAEKEDRSTPAGIGWALAMSHANEAEACETLRRAGYHPGSQQYAEGYQEWRRLTSGTTLTGHKIL